MNSEASTQVSCEPATDRLYPIDQPGAWWRHRVCDGQSQIECDKLIVVGGPASPVPGRPAVDAVPVLSLRAHEQITRWQEVRPDGSVHRHLDVVRNDLGVRTEVAWYCPSQLRVPSDADACTGREWDEDVVTLEVKALDAGMADCESAIDSDTCTILAARPGCSFSRTVIQRTWRVVDDAVRLDLPPGAPTEAGAVHVSIRETTNGRVVENEFWWVRGVGKLMELDGKDSTREILIDRCVAPEDCTRNPPPVAASVEGSCSLAQGCEGWSDPTTPDRIAP